MDFQALFYSIAVVAILILIFLSIIFLVLLSQKPVLPGPSLLEYLPGGTVYSMFQDSRNTGDVLDRVRETHGETSALWFGPVRVVLTSVPRDVVHIVSFTKEFRRPDPMLFIFNTFAPNGLFTMSENSHRAARKSMRAHFDHSMLQSFHGKMSDATTELCEALAAVAGKGAINIWKFLAVITFRVITNVAFGAEMEKEERMKFNAATDTLADEMIKELVGYPIRQKLSVFGVRNDYMKCIQTIRGMCLRFIEKRLAETKAQRKSRSPDMLDTFLEIGKGDANLAAALAIEFATAGSHTANQVLTWTMYELCCNPDAVKKLYDELDREVGHKPVSEPLSLEDLQKLEYVVQIWKEVLRRRPTTSVIMRVTTQDVRLKGSGVQLPKGTVVSAFYGYCHVDPQIWTNPLEFRPERWEEVGKSEGYRVPPGAYMPFSMGELSCAGRFLADYEGPLIIAEIYRRFKFELACKAEEVKRRSQFIDVPQYVQEDSEGGVPVKVYLRQGQ